MLRRSSDGGGKNVCLFVRKSLVSAKGTNGVGVKVVSSVVTFHDRCKSDGKNCDHIFRIVLKIVRLT